MTDYCVDARPCFQPLQDDYTRVILWKKSVRAFVCVCVKAERSRVKRDGSTQIGIATDTGRHTHTHTHTQPLTTRVPDHFSFNRGLNTCRSKWRRFSSLARASISSALCSHLDVAHRGRTSFTSMVSRSTEALDTYSLPPLHSSTLLPHSSHLTHTHTHTHTHTPHTPTRQTLRIQCFYDS